MERSSITSELGVLCIEFLHRQAMTPWISAEEAIETLTSAITEIQQEIKKLQDLEKKLDHHIWHMKQIVWHMKQIANE